MKKEIFLVEDSPDFRQIVRIIFEKYLPEYKIRSFQGAHEMYKYMILQSDENFQGRRPVLIILDLKMLTLSGLEVIKMLRKTPENAVTLWQTIPIVMLSASASQEDINNCYLAGATSFFNKPVELEELKQLLIRICHYWVDYNKLATPKTSVPLMKLQ